MAEKEYTERWTLMRKECPMRHANGNCLPCGGFCTAVVDPICEAMHNAYYMGKKPAADVVEVVRRKDCKYYEEGIREHSCFHPKQECGWNSEGGEYLEMKPYDFCSYGEKMDGKGEN